MLARMTCLTTEKGDGPWGNECTSHAQCTVLQSVYAQCNALACTTSLTLCGEEDFVELHIVQHTACPSPRRVACGVLTELQKIV